MPNNVFASFDEAVADIPNGASICMDSFAIAGTPHNLVAALRRRGIKHLTIIVSAIVPQIFPEDAFNFPSVLLPQMKKLVTTTVGIARLGGGAFIEEYVAKGLEIEVTGFGNFSARLSAGAARLGGIYSPVGPGTVLEKGKEKRVIDGVDHIFERPIRADYAFIMAYRADKLGNLVYRGIYRNVNALMAMAADITIVEVEDEIVEPGGIDPEHVVTPGIFVDRMVQIPEDGLATPRKQKQTIYSISEIEEARRVMFQK